MHHPPAYALVSRKAWSLSEPGARFILPVLVTEFCFEDFAFLACSKELHRNENDEEPEIARLIDIEKGPRDRQASEYVNGVANSRIEGGWPTLPCATPHPIPG